MGILKRTWAKPEAFRVECDVHHWMSAFIVVVENPYWGISDTAGAVRIEGVPAGKHTVAVVHELLGRRDVEVDVPADGEVTFEVTFDASELTD